MDFLVINDETLDNFGQRFKFLIFFLKQYIIRSPYKIKYYFEF